MKTPVRALFIAILAGAILPSLAFAGNCLMPHAYLLPGAYFDSAARAGQGIRIPARQAPEFGAALDYGFSNPGGGWTAALNGWTGIARMFDLGLGLGFCDTGIDNVDNAFVAAASAGMDRLIPGTETVLRVQGTISRYSINSVDTYSVPVIAAIRFALRDSISGYAGPLIRYDRSTVSGYSSSDTKFGGVVGANAKLNGRFGLNLSLVLLAAEGYDTSTNENKTKIGSSLNLGLVFRRPPL
jgi:hypothetical protein